MSLSRLGRRRLAERSSGPRCLATSAALNAADTRSAWSRLQTYDVTNDACTYLETLPQINWLRESTTAPQRISTNPRMTSSADSEIDSRCSSGVAQRVHRLSEKTAQPSPC